MTSPDDPNPTPDAEGAHPAAGVEVPTGPAGEVRSVVSVRFNRGELDAVAAAAATAGQPLSTYIRTAALSAATAVDVAAARRQLASVTRALADLHGTLHPDADRPRP